MNKDGFTISVGNVFGRLTAVENKGMVPYGKAKQNHYSWLFRCQCGTMCTKTVNSVKSGSTRSCGCLFRETISSHGMTGTPEHAAWKHIKARCYDKNNNGYYRYGGRGITMSEEWKNSFEAFYRDMGPKPSSTHSVDRIDNDKGYYKDNCRWATTGEQAANKSTNVRYMYNGKSYLQGEFANIVGVSGPACAYWRSRGLNGDEIYTLLRRTILVRKRLDVITHLDDGEVTPSFDHHYGVGNWLLLSNTMTGVKSVVYKLAIRHK